MEYITFVIQNNNPLFRINTSSTCGGCLGLTSPAITNCYAIVMNRLVNSTTLNIKEGIGTSTMPTPTTITTSSSSSSGQEWQNVIFETNLNGDVYEAKFYTSNILRTTRTITNAT